eukprot:m.170281 g.170281  ORF g.170281 m.170281 type:complete len:451 (+) comp31607_c0_seq2:274-1626(+)
MWQWFVQYLASLFGLLHYCEHWFDKDRLKMERTFTTVADLRDTILEQLQTKAKPVDKTNSVDRVVVFQTRGPSSGSITDGIGLLSHGKQFQRGDLNCRSSQYSECTKLLLGPDCVFDTVLLTDGERKKYKYPNRNKDFIAISCLESTGRESLVAIDCEMVDTVHGKELARVSLTNAVGEVLLDKLVCPKGKIVDYLTEFSGITEDILQGVDTTLENIHDHLQAILWKGSVLVGHSLENDLYALKLYHPRVIDTAVRYQGKFGMQKLRVLSRRHLDRIIQDGAAGHDSVEDARATMDLALRLLMQAEKQTSLCEHLQDSNRKVLLFGPMKLCAVHARSGARIHGANNTNMETILQQIEDAFSDTTTSPQFIFVDVGSLTTNHNEMTETKEMVEKLQQILQKTKSGSAVLHIIEIPRSTPTAKKTNKNKTQKKHPKSHNQGPRGYVSTVALR